MPIDKFRIFVFANLKPSQISYKIVPLSKASMVDHIYILRKTPLQIRENKITCLNLPWLLRQRPLYWFFTAFYGVFLMRKYQTNLILNYNIFPHGFNAYLASKLSRQRVIFSEINEDTMNYFLKTGPRILIKCILKNASVICTPGSNTSSFWNNNGFKNTTPLHSTIDTSKFIPDTAKIKKYDFIFIGELDKNKRPDLILEAFNEIHINNPAVTFCIIGFGKLEQDLKNQIAKLQLRDHVSLIKTNDALKYLQHSKVLVLASLSEGLPCVMMEAMSCELSVVVPPVGNINDIVNHGINGFLHNNTKEGLVKCMKESILNYDNHVIIRKNAREAIINDHSYQVATAKWNILLNTIKEQKKL